RRVSIPMTSAMQASISKHPAPPVRPPDIWVRPDYDVTPEEDAMAERVDQKAEGFHGPSCIYCPRAEYSDGAMITKVQGTLTLKALFSREGYPLKLIVIEGLPCGLNRAALDAVSRWKVHPATNPDGKPVEIWQELEITFQQY